MPGFKPMPALACTPTPLVPIEIPRSAFAAMEGAIPKVADTSIIVMVLLPRPTPITPPAPTEGVMVASRQISSRLSETEQVTDEDGAAIVIGMLILVTKDAASATEVEGMISVTEGQRTDEVGSGMCGVIDRLASTSITVPVNTASLVTAPEFTTVVSPCAKPDDVSSPEDDCVTVTLWSPVLGAVFSDACADVITEGTKVDDSSDMNELTDTIDDDVGVGCGSLTEPTGDDNVIGSEPLTGTLGDADDNTDVGSASLFNRRVEVIAGVDWEETVIGTIAEAIALVPPVDLALMPDIAFRVEGRNVKPDAEVPVLR
jgi:hypothetical protein